MIDLVTHLFFSTQGRITRQAWWIGIAGLAGWNLFVFVVLWSILGPSLVLNFFGRLVWLCFMALTIYATYCLSAKRFQDRNRSALNAKVVAGVWAVKAVLDLFHVTGELGTSETLDQTFMLIAIGIGLWYVIELGGMQGSWGPNDYGADPIDAKMNPQRDT